MGQCYDPTPAFYKAMGKSEGTKIEPTVGSFMLTPEQFTQILVTISLLAKQADSSSQVPDSQEKPVDILTSCLLVHTSPHTEPDVLASQIQIKWDNHGAKLEAKAKYCEKACASLQYNMKILDVENMVSLNSKIDLRLATPTVQATLKELVNWA